MEFPLGDGDYERYILGECISIDMRVNVRYELSRLLLTLSRKVWDEEGESFSFSMMVLSEEEKRGKGKLNLEVEGESRFEWDPKYP